MIRAAGEYVGLQRNKAMSVQLKQHCEERDTVGRVSEVLRRRIQIQLLDDCDQLNGACAVNMQGPELTPWGYLFIP